MKQTKAVGLDLGFFAVLAIIYIVGIVTMPLEEIKGDAMAVRFETSNLLDRGEWGVPEYIAKFPGQEPGQYFFHNAKTGKYYPKYGVLNSLMYLPPLLLEKIYRDELRISSPSRVVYLNIYNIFLSALCGAFIYLTSKLFSSTQIINVGYTILIIYSTFLWNYFRAQTFEIYQLAFFSAALYFALKYIQLIAESSGDQLPSKRYLLLTSFFLTLLVLTKSVYFVILPIFAISLAYAVFKSPRGEGDSFREIVTFLIIPLGAVALLFLYINKIRFGDYFCTGYMQWAKERNLFGGDLFHNIWGYFFSLQFGILACFPPLLIALFCWKDFYKKFNCESILILLTFIVLLVVDAKFINWKGEQCYGPRYLIVILPSLSLPFLTTLEYFSATRNLTHIKTALFILISILLTYSFTLNLNVNRFPFLVYYKLQKDPFKYPEFTKYLSDRPYGEINADLYAFKTKGIQFPPVGQLNDKIDGEERDKINLALKDISRSNYYFFK